MYNKIPRMPIRVMDPDGTDLSLSVILRQVP
jgi:hypothetical protein